ncbi:MAG: beta-lactamase family protein [Alphaproteobacteria bacterium]|nr:beta-lactamase family protein [Alphaproteobacteria bacterium]
MTDVTKRPLLKAGLAVLDAAFTTPAWARPVVVDPALVGDWSGILGGQGGLRVKFAIAADGAVMVYSLDQGGWPIPATADQLSADEISIRVPAVKGKLEGKLKGDEIAATWSKGQPQPLTLKRGEAGLKAAPVPALTTESLAALHAAAGSPAMAAIAQARGAAARAWVDGVRRVDTPAKATADDLWHIGSITKSMTATLVARLVEQGAVAWTDTVAQRLGPQLPAMPEPYASANFLHLLSHHAGLAANIPMLQFLPYYGSKADVRADRLKWAGQAFAQKPTAALGAPGVYSNSGFVIAGAMLEHATGQGWEDLITAHLFEPLGMTRAGFGAPQGDQPWGHTKKLLGPGRNPIKPDRTGDNPAVLGPAGRVHLPLADLLRFLRAHADRTDFLKAETWDRLHTPPFGGDSALGLLVRDGGQLWRNGSNTRWYAEIAIDPKGGKVAAAAANDGAVEQSQPAVATALAGALAAV